jgi:hypothetical protein
LVTPSEQVSIALTIRQVNVTFFAQSSVSRTEQWLDRFLAVFAQPSWKIEIG